jgi:hypothetical protein
MVGVPLGAALWIWCRRAREVELRRLEQKRLRRSWRYLMAVHAPPGALVRSK